MISLGDYIAVASCALAAAASAGATYRKYRGYAKRGQNLHVCGPNLREFSSQALLELEDSCRHLDSVRHSWVNTSEELVKELKKIDNTLAAKRSQYDILIKELEEKIRQPSASRAE